jgi:hypothetical protein
MKRTLFVLAIGALFACNAGPGEETKTEAAPATDAAATTSSLLPAADLKTIQDGIQAFCDGDQAAWMATYADNAKIYYPGTGDSLVGKPGLEAFFKTRTDSVVSATFTNATYLAVDKQDGSGYAANGKWLMAWGVFTIKYKNGKTAYMPIHLAHHMDASGKTDMAAWYYDQVDIMNAK